MSTKQDENVKDLLLNVPQTVPLPSSSCKRSPIIIIGGGSIAQIAHIPTYIEYSFPIAAICDLDKKQLTECKQLLSAYKHIQYFDNMQSLLTFIAKSSNSESFIFDIATRPLSYFSILSELPSYSNIICQKPFGHNLESSKNLVKLIHAKHFNFATLYSLRYSSIMLYLSNALKTKNIGSYFGDIIDVEMTEKYLIPWSNWPWLKAYGEWIEIVFHSIHFLDALQSIFGVPDRVFAEIGNRPNAMQCILVYGDEHLQFPKLRIRVYVDHNCKYQKEEVLLNVNGSKGALLGSIGSILGESDGQNNKIKDTLKVKVDALEKKEAMEIKLQKSWMYESFYGPISNLQRFINGEDDKINTDIKSCYNTQLLIYALQKSEKEKKFVNMYDVQKKHGIESIISCKL